MTGPDATPREHRAHAPTSVACFVLTISDTRTPETDTGGAVVRDLLARAGHTLVGSAITKDEPVDVQRIVREQCADPAVQAVILMSGTSSTSLDSSRHAVQAVP